MACVVHLSPREVVELPAYQAWLASFASQTSHLLVAEAIRSDIPVQRRAAMLQAKLNFIDPGMFVLHSTLGQEQKGAEEAADGTPLPEHCTVGSNMLRYHLRPVAKQGLDSGEGAGQSGQEPVWLGQAVAWLCLACGTVL